MNLLATTILTAYLSGGLVPLPGQWLPWYTDVSAYCPCEQCCGVYADGMTAAKTKANHPLAAAPSVIPFGTQMYIPGYQDYLVKVEDRGGAIRGNKLDLLYPTHQEALVWGRRQMVVWVYLPE